ncbi:MAG: long-chain acyl-CoA synthetase, partial [bacterium]
MTVQTLNDLFTEAVRHHDKPDAFQVKRGGAWRDISHREAARAVDEIAAGLIELGVEPGDRVAILSENRPE